MLTAEMSDTLQSGSLLYDGSDCYQQLKELLLDSSNHYTPYYDATGKVGSGFTDGNVISLGDYQQCSLQNNSQYCLADVTAQERLPGVVNSTPVHILWGLCAVNTCNASAVESIGAQLITDIFSLKWLHTENLAVNCVSQWMPSTHFWAAMCLLAFMFVLLVCGTLLDVRYRYTARMKWHLLYHVSPNVRQLVGPPRGQGHMTWVTIDEPYISNDSLTGDTESRESGPPSERLIEMAYQYKPGFTVSVGRCFSLLTHIDTLSTRSQSNLPCLDGLRVLSLCVVIFGQTAYAMFNAPNVVNRHAVGRDSTRVSFQLAINSYCAIDSFFFISGLLTVFNVLNTLQTNGGKRQFVLHYMHRLLRLTPAVAVATLFWTTIFPYVSSGPLWLQLTPMIDKQSRYWWSSLIYLQNFYPPELLETCMPWLWYISADFQLYCFTAILLIFLCRKKTSLFIVLPLLASIIVTAVLIGVYDLDVSFANYFESHDKSQVQKYLSIVWTKPYCRASSYLVGCWLGYRLHIENGLASRLRKHTAAVGWVLCILLCGSVVFVPYPTYFGYSFNIVANAIYGSLRHFAWAAAMAWIVYCCFHGYGGPVNCILSWSVWSPLSKMAFSVFVCHGIWLSWYLYSQHTALVLTTMTVTSLCLSTLFGSLLLGTSLALLVELPIRNLEKYIRS